MSEEGISFSADGEVLNQFLGSPELFPGHEHIVDIIEGPQRSGKTVACLFRLIKHAQQQALGKDGIRRTRWLITRNTYPELESTVLQSFLEWFRDFVTVKMGPPIIVTLKFGDVHADFWLMPLESTADIPKLRGIEFTGAWVNECQYFDFDVFGELLTRINQYPPKKEGGPTWGGIIADMNTPEEAHWTNLMFGVTAFQANLSADERMKYDCPKGWFHFTQPPAVVETRDPDTGEFLRYDVNVGQDPNTPGPAENLEHLNGGEEYYRKAMGGKDRTWIDVNLRNIPGSQRRGKPVYPEYSEFRHVAKNGEIEFMETYPLSAGVDPGLTRSAVVFFQVIRGQYWVLSELITEGAKADELGRRILHHLAEFFPNHPPVARIRFWGDEFGNRPNQTGDPVYDVLKRQFGIKVATPKRANYRRVEKNAVDIRKDAFGKLLLADPRVAGQGIRIHPFNVPIFKAGLQGGYQWKTVKTPQGDVLVEPPTVDKRVVYADVVEAFEYGLIGEGAVRDLLGLSDEPARIEHSRPAGQSLRKYNRAARAAARNFRHAP